MKTQFIKKSSNAKTGAIPVTNSSRETCPPSCPFIKNGCYADAGYYTRLNWDKLTNGERGSNWSDFVASIAKLPDGQLWRHNVSGDLAGSNDVIDAPKLRDLVTANAGKKGFTYCHYPMDKAPNKRAVKSANAAGFTVNISANSASEAAQLFTELGLPVVTVLPIDSPKKQTVAGIDIITCPATYRDDVTCKSCGLCQVSDRRVIVGFPAHGSQAKSADVIAREV